MLSLVERAAPPDERREGRWFSVRPDGNQARLDKLAGKWREAVGGEGRFAAGLREAGLGYDAFRAGLAEVTLSDPSLLPAWAAALIDLITDEPPVSAEPVRIDGAPYLKEIASLLIEPARFLRAAAMANNLAVGEDALQEIVAGFAKRLATVVGQILEFEARLAQANAGLFGQASGQSADGTLEGWLSRMERFPVLAFLIGQSYSAWRNWISEIFERLRSDSILLSDTLFAGEGLGELTGFQGDAGDVHGGGRTVAILTFDRSRKVVYKPKDLRCAVAFLSLIDLLNRSGLELKLHTRRVLPRGGYAWEEFVAHEPCASEAELERFYVRMGMLARLLQFVEGRDFWLDNLVAHGEFPVFVDLETILQPRAIPGQLLPAEQVARHLVAESVVETCVIAMPTPIGMGMPAEDYGALATSKLFITPYRRDLPAAGAAGYFTWTHEEHSPTLNGAPADAAKYLSQVVAGYRSMQECLLANRSRLSSSEGPLAALRDLPVRFIYRDTWTYHKIIRKSLSPPLLTDQGQRELYLQQLLRPALDRETDESEALIQCAMIRSEIGSLRRLDIPFFVSKPESNSVFTVQGDEFRGYFDDTAFRRIEERLHGLEAFSTDSQVELLLSCFATGRPGASRSVTPGSRLPGRAHHSNDELVDAAVEIGETILADAITSDSEELAWIGLAYHPEIDLLSLGVLEADLLSGTCGLAILFADLFEITGEERWARACRGALASTVRQAEKRAEFGLPVNGHSQAEIASSYWGGFVGLGSHIFTLRYCARKLRSQSLHDIANATIASLPAGAAYRNASYDIVSGAAGLLLAILPASRGDVATENQAVRADELIEMLLAQSGETGGVASDVRASTIATGPDGLSMSLARMRRISGEWGSERRRGFLTDWKARPIDENGAHLLARLDVVQSGGGVSASLFEAIDKFLSRSPRLADTVGLLEQVDIAAGSFAAGRELRYKEAAAERAFSILDIRRRHGSWFPSRYAAARHSLSLIWGTAGVARSLLRAWDPDKAPSIASLRLPEI